MEPACSPRVSPWAVSEAQIASTAQKELERGFRQMSKIENFSLSRKVARAARRALYRVRTPPRRRGCE